MILRHSIHPGEYLKEELEERNISQSRLAHHIGIEPGVINVICNGRRGISALMAKKLAAALGTSPELWMNLQSSYELSQVEDPDISRIEAGV